MSNSQLADIGTIIVLVGVFLAFAGLAIILLSEIR